MVLAILGDFIDDLPSEGSSIVEMALCDFEIRVGVVVGITVHEY